jgi:hypothetical protein
LYVGLIGGLAAGAAECTIELDGVLDDWAGVVAFSDPVGDDRPAHHDLVEMRVCHDDRWLYFMLRVDSTDGDYYGNSNRYEQLIVYLDVDDRLDTGFRVGPDGQQIGAEYALVSGRRVSTGGSSEGTLYSGGDPWYGNPARGEEAELIGNLTGNRGLPRVADREVVYAFETGVPRDAVRLVHGGTVGIMVRAARSGDNSQTDWLDTAVHYNLPAPAHLGTFQLRSPTLEYRFAAPEQGLGLVGLIHRRRERAFLRVPDRAADALFWKVVLNDDPADPDAAVTVTNNTPAAKRDVVHDDKQWTLTWMGVELPDDRTIDVNVTCHPGAAQNGLDEWRIAVTNHSETYGIWRTLFPVFELGAIGDSSLDDTIIMSPAEGRSLRNPIYWGLDIDGPQINTDITTDNVAVEMLPEQIDFGGFGAARPHGLPYPTARGQMQLSAYYEKSGDFYFPAVRPGAGLYMATHDDRMYPKIFFYTPNPRRGVLLYEVVHHPDDSCRPGLDHAPPYPTVIGGFEGDWFDATQIYRSWAETARWARPGPLAVRDDVPMWLKTMTAVVRADVKKNDNRVVLEQLARIREVLPGPVGVQWYNWSAWEKRPDRSGFAFPARAEGPEGFAEIVAEIQSQNMAVFPYMNTRLWNLDEEDYDTVRPFIMQRQNGEPYVNEAKKGHGVAHPCLQTEFWQDYLTDACRRLVELYSPRGIYLDQGAEAHFGGYFDYQGCHDPKHGHPLGVTQDMIRAEYDRVAKIYRAAREIRKDIVLTGEGNAECFNDIVSNKLIHYELWPGNVPMFAAVYHDYVTAYGRTVSLVAKNPDDPIPAMRIGWQLALGNQIGRIWSSTVGPRFEARAHYAENVDYLRRAAALRERYPEYLCVGRMLRPPFVDGQLPTITTNEFSRIDHRVTLPAVVGSTWQAADGSTGMLLTNMSRASVTLVFWLAPGEMTGTQLARVYADRGMADDVALGPLVRQTKIPPLGIAFYQVR